MTRKALTVTLSACLLLAACSSSGGTKATTTTPAAQSTAAYSAAPGDDAALIAGHITGCTGVTSGNIGAGGASGLSSTATCTLQGHLLIIDSFTDGGRGDISKLADPDEYFATSGQGWDVFLADETGSAEQTVLQLQITNDASALLGATPRPVDADAQRTLLAVVAKDLGGMVEQGQATP